MKVSKIYRYLRFLRILAGLTQRQLARLLHVEQPLVSKIERGILSGEEIKDLWIKVCREKSIVTVQNIVSILNIGNLKLA